MSRTSHAFGAASQLSFYNGTRAAGPSGLAHSSMGTVWTQPGMSGLYTPKLGTSATFYAYVQDAKWLKGGAPVGQSQRSDGRKPAASALVVLRNDRLWVDRPSLYATYALQDEDGSFAVDTSSLAVSLSGAGLGSAACSTAHLGVIAARHMEACELSVAESVFTGLSSDEAREGSLQLVAASGGTPVVTALPATTLTRPPNWYDSGLRSGGLGSRAGAPATIGTSSFVTLPTHPVYADASFDDPFTALLFLHDERYAAESWTFELKYDASRITYHGFTVSSDFNTPR